MSVAAGDNVQSALWQVYEAETGEEATAEDAFAESSEGRMRDAEMAYYDPVVSPPLLSDLPTLPYRL